MGGRRSRAQQPRDCRNSGSVHAIGCMAMSRSAARPCPVLSPPSNSPERTILMWLSRPRRPGAATSAAIPAHSGVCRVQQSHGTGATPSRSSTRATKPPADDAAATRWPSRVLLLVERRFGVSRASCAMDLIRVDAAGPRNRRFRAVDEQQHCCTAALRARPRRAGRPTSACSTSPRATRLSPEPHPGCVRKLSMRTSQLRSERRGTSEKFRASQRRTKVLAS